RSAPLKQALRQSLGHAQGSASAQQFLRRVRESHSLLDAGEAEQALDLLWTSHETERAPGLIGPLVRLYQRAEAGRVHEIQFTQVDDDVRRSGVAHPGKFF